MATWRAFLAKHPHHTRFEVMKHHNLNSITAVRKMWVRQFNYRIWAMFVTPEPKPKRRRKTKATALE
jgi:hypothetical protein